MRKEQARYQAEADLSRLRRAEEIRSQPSRPKVAVQIDNEDIRAMEKIKKRI